MQATVINICQTYWIPQICSVLEKHFRKCVHCKHHSRLRKQDTHQRSDHRFYPNKETLQAGLGVVINCHIALYHREQFESSGLEKAN